MKSMIATLCILILSICIISEEVFWFGSQPYQKYSIKTMCIEGYLHKVIEVPGREPKVEPMVKKGLVRGASGETLVPERSVRCTCP